MRARRIGEFMQCGAASAALAAAVFSVLPAAAAAEPPWQDPFAGAVYRIRDAQTGRVSSWDRT